MRYMFRLRFFVKDGSLLDNESESIEFHMPTGLKRLTLSASRGAKSLKEAQWFVFTATGFESEEDAWYEGRRLRDNLQYIAVRMKKSIDFGSDKPTGQMNDVFKQRMEMEADKIYGEGVRFYDNVHGLAVYAESPQPMIPEFYGQISVEKILGPSFESLLTEVYALNLSLDERSSLACALYGAAQVEETPRVQFLILIMAIESLFENEDRVPEAVALVDSFIESTQQSMLDSSEKNSLLGSLKWLRYESISRMGKQFVKKYVGNQRYGGMRATDFFRHCYSIRSQIMHNGKPESEAVRIPSLVHQLDKLVVDILNAVIGIPQGSG